MNLYGKINALQLVDDTKLGELHMRLNVLLGLPAKKAKNKSPSLKTQGQQDLL